MQVVPVEDAAALKTWSSIEAATREADHVGLPADPLEDRLPLLDPELDTDEKVLLRLGCVDGVAVAAAEVHLPTKDNLGSASFDVRVLPELRRQGHGRALLDAVLAEIAELGRTRLFCEVPSPYPSGPALAEQMLRAVGSRPVLTEVRRVLDLQETPPSPPHDPPAGYRVVQWVDEVPDELLEDMAYLMHRMSTDVPLGEMDWEPEVWDGKRYRDKEAESQARGRIRYATAVVHEASGKAAGFTDIGVSRYADAYAWQWETLVDREHRGNRLGMLLKAHNHWQLAQKSPQTRWVNTWNAESNSHMIAVNEAMGFVPVEYWTEWQLDR